jgi:hypothetical protein
MENLRLREAAPTSVNVTVGKRSREYLTDREVERLIEAGYLERKFGDAYQAYKARVRRWV